MDVTRQIYNMEVAEVGRVNRKREREREYHLNDSLAPSKPLHQRKSYCLAVSGDTKPQESNLQEKVKRIGLRKGKSGAEICDFRIMEGIASIGAFLFLPSVCFRSQELGIQNV